MHGMQIETRIRDTTWQPRAHMSGGGLYLLVTREFYKARSPAPASEAGRPILPSMSPGRGPIAHAMVDLDGPQGPRTPRHKSADGQS